jgi:NAD(P)H-nitrite reductase large subunit
VQARGFFEPSKVLNATLPNAVEQGRIAGMDMVDDPALKVYQGAVSLNTYKFFGHRAFSVGMIRAEEGCEVEKAVVPERFKYQKLVFKADHLVGASGINSDLDPGVMVQLIRRKATGRGQVHISCRYQRVMMTSGDERQTEQVKRLSDSLEFPSPVGRQRGEKNAIFLVACFPLPYIPLPPGEGK